MIGILGGMGTQAGLDLCNKLSMLYRGKSDQEYPKFILYNKTDTPERPKNLKKYFNVLNELVKGCKLLQRNNCKFIVMPGNTAHYWYDDLKKNRYTRPTIKKYLYTQVQTNFLRIDINQAPVVVFLPVAQFRNANTRAVYRDSRGML